MHEEPDAGAERGSAEVAGEREVAAVRLRVVVSKNVELHEKVVAAEVLAVRTLYEQVVAALAFWRWTTEAASVFRIHMTWGRNKREHTMKRDEKNCTANVINVKK